MFYILDGRSHFYQWDIDRKIVVEDKTITQVHFCNRTDECSLVVEVYDLDGLRVANVPNILLQQDWRINVYAYDSKYTKHCEVYEVARRSKPADYVYTETETLNYSTLLERMNDIEGSIEDVVTDYLTENPPMTDLTGYATEEYVQKQLESVEVDLTGYATEKYVDDAIAGIDIPEAVVEEKEVYIGAEEPTDPDVKLWIDPDAESPWATTEYVDEKIGAGSGLHFSSNLELSTEEIELITNLWKNRSLETPITIDGKLVIAFANTSGPGMVAVANSSYYNDGLYFMIHYYLYTLANNKLVVSEDISDKAAIHASEVIVPDNCKPSGVAARLSSVLDYFTDNLQTAADVEAAITSALGKIGVAEEGEY